MINQPAKKKSRRNLVVAIITTITALSWVGFEAYRAYITTKIKPATRQLLTPLLPELDIEILEDLKEKNGLPRQEVKTLIPKVLPPTPTQETLPTPTIDQNPPTESSGSTEIETQNQDQPLP